MIYYIAIAFGLIAFFNIVIRFTVLKMYNELRRNGVQFSTRLFFNENELRDFSQKQYPEEVDKIMRFVKYTKFAMIFATVLISLILFLGFILLRMK